VNMIERVRQAVIASTQCPGPNISPPYGACQSDDRCGCYRSARAAIEAMLEPTNGMLGEAAKAMSPGKRPTPEFVSVNQKHKIRYQAMIRKALEE